MSKVFTGLPMDVYRYDREMDLWEINNKPIILWAWQQKHTEDIWLG